MLKSTYLDASLFGVVLEVPFDRPPVVTFYIHHYATLANELIQNGLRSCVAKLETVYRFANLSVKTFKIESNVTQ